VRKSGQAAATGLPRRPDGTGPLPTAVFGTADGCAARQHAQRSKDRERLPFMGGCKSVAARSRT